MKLAARGGPGSLVLRRKNATPEFYLGRGPDELATLFERYLTGRSS
jgi:hypothetical protein